MEPSSNGNLGQSSDGAISPRLIVAMAVVILLATAASLWATQPGWWNTRNAVNPSATPDDYAMANEGQLKQFTLQAVNEMNANLPGGAGDALNSLVNGWISDYASNGYNGSNPKPSDYQAMNTGQLKTIGSMVWNRLLAVGYTNSLPGWLVVTGSDTQAANLGQLKTVFNFNITYSSIGSTLPDWWLDHYYGSVSAAVSAGVSATGTVPYSDGTLTYEQAYKRGRNPVDFYNGRRPTLAIVSGNAQAASAGEFVSEPLIVLVTDSNGDVIAGAPVTYSVESGGGHLQASGTAAPQTTESTLAGRDGEAQMYFQLPSDSTTSDSNQILVTAGVEESATEATFTEYNTGTGPTSPFAPSNVQGTMNPDGSETITWINNNSKSPIYIYYQSSNGTWTMVSPPLPAGTDTYTAAESMTGSVEIGNNFTPGGSTGTISGRGTRRGVIPYVPLEVQAYAAIDMSSGITTQSIDNVALDDNNNVAFGFYTDPNANPGDRQYEAYTWSDGSATQRQDIHTEQYQQSGAYLMRGTRADVEYLTLGGTCYGNGVSMRDGRKWWGSAVEFSNNQPTPIFPPPPYGPLTRTGYGVVQEPNSLTITDAESFGYCGTISGMVPRKHSTPKEQPDSNGGIIVASNTTIFDPVVANHAATPGTATVVAKKFTPTILNVNGWAVGGAGKGGNNVWNGRDLVPLAPMIYSVGINDIGQVVGSNSRNSDVDGHGFLWTDASTHSTCPLVISGSVQNISDLLPGQYRREVRSIYPIGISGTDADGNASILFNASYKIPADARRLDDYYYGTFVLTLTNGAVPSRLAKISLPSNINPAFGGSNVRINSSQIIVTAGQTEYNSHYARGAAFLLLPVQLVNKADPTQRNGADGTDKQIDLMSSSTGTDINAVAWIAASDTTQAQVVTGVYPPRMPELVASSGSIPGLTYCWKLQVIFHDRHGNPHRDFDTGDPNDTNPSASVAPQDTVKIPATSNSSDSNAVNGWVQITDGSPWNIYQDNDWINAQLQGFFGGDAELSLKILDSNGNTICPEQDYYFRIAGENPTADAVTAAGDCQNYINSIYDGPTPNWQSVVSTGTNTPPTVPGYWFAYAIAKEETAGDGGRPWYNNFLDSGGQYQAVHGKEGKPDWNNDGSSANPTTGSGGYGLFQLTFQPGDTNYIMPRDWIWNWQSNVQQFLPIAQQKLGYTQGYLNYIRAHNASYFDPSSLTTTADTTTFNFWESSVITLNNGASIIVGSKGHRRAGAWSFQSGPPAAWQYVPNKPSPGYLYQVAHKGVEGNQQ